MSIMEIQKKKKNKKKTHQHAIRNGDTNTSVFSATRMAGAAKHQLTMTQQQQY